ncbi:MAG: APC family permease [Candidatus Kryptoniota bacterium]
MKNRLNNSELKREIGLFSATILVIANMVGTGIFTTSGFIIKELGDPQTMLLCWFLGGIFALSGAFCFGELGAMFPRAGGEYVFLRESFGKGAAFLSGWISLIVGFSAPIAAAAIAFATYLFRLLLVPAAGFTFNIFGINILTISTVTISAVCIIIIISTIHYHSIFLGTKVQNVLTLFKVSLIILFIIAGFVWGQGSASHFKSSFIVNTIFQDKFAVSLIFVSFAYSGWNAAAYLGGEIIMPGRNIPLALLAGTFFVMCFYLMLNVVYIYALPATKMQGVLEVGAVSAIALFGKDIGQYFTGAIALGLLSVLSAMIMAGPRVYYAMAKDGVFFELFGKVNALHRTPVYSISLQAAISILMVLTASFDALLLYIGFTLSLCATLTVIGMMKLRFTKPELQREYKTIGYPLTPLMFIAGNLWIIYFSIMSRPITAIAGVGTIGFGLLVYYYFRRGKKKEKPDESCEPPAHP